MATDEKRIVTGETDLEKKRGETLSTLSEKTKDNALKTNFSSVPDLSSRIEESF